MRGSITDREGRVLATSADADTVYAVPTEIDDDEAHGAQVVRGPRGLPRVERAAGRAGGQAVEEPAVHLREAACLARRGRRGRRAQAGRRRACARRAAGSTRCASCWRGVLGYVGLDNKGLAGIEQRYNDIIRGKDGQALVHTDAKRHAFDSIERAADLRRVPRADARRGVAARRRARAGARRRRAPRRQRRGHRHGPVDRRGAGHGQRPDLQPQRVRRGQA